MNLKTILTVFAWLFTGFANASVSDDRVTVDLFFELGESRYEAASVLLRSASDHIEREENVLFSEGHEAFSRLVGNSTTFTSVLAIDRDGALLFDSFNETQTIVGMDLSDRRYYGDLQDVYSSSSAVVFPEIVGRQSGNRLIPIAKRVPEITSERARVVVALMRPESLIPNVSLCSSCGLFVLRDGELITSDRPLTQMNEAIAERMQFVGYYGSDTVRVRGFDVRMHWRNSATSDLTYVYYVGQPVRDRF